MASFPKEVNPRLTKRPLETNGPLANLELTPLVNEATEVHVKYLLSSPIQIYKTNSQDVSVYNAGAKS